MNTRKPGLKWHRHKRLYYVRRQGRCVYLGRDREQARHRYHAEMIDWAKRRAQHEIVAAQRRRFRDLTLADLYDRFIDAKRTEVRPDTVRHYQAHLRRFVAVYHWCPASAITPHNVQSIKTDLIAGGLRPRTVNHEIACIKAMLQWGVDFELIPQLHLRAVKPVRLDPPPPKGYSVAQMRRMIRWAPARLKPWLRVNWLTACRPAEVVRLVNGEGQWIDEGVFRLTQAKTRDRHLLLSELAIKHLKRCHPVFHHLNSYGQACRRHCKCDRSDPNERGMTPHPLRHGAAQELVRRGVRRQVVDLILGHMPGRTSLTYVPIAWQPLRDAISCLDL